MRVTLCPSWPVFAGTCSVLKTVPFFQMGTRPQIEGKFREISQREWKRSFHYPKLSRRDPTTGHTPFGGLLEPEAQRVHKDEGPLRASRSFLQVRGCPSGDGDSAPRDARAGDALPSGEPSRRVGAGEPRDPQLVAQQRKGPASGSRFNG